MSKPALIKQAIVIVVTLPGPGSLQALAQTKQRTGRKTTTISVGHARSTAHRRGRIKLRINLSARARALLKRLGRITVQVTTTHIPSGGAPGQRRVRVTI